MREIVEGIEINYKQINLGFSSNLDAAVRSRITCLL